MPRRAAPRRAAPLRTAQRPATPAARREARHPLRRVARVRARDRARRARARASLSASAAPDVSPPARASPQELFLSTLVSEAAQGLGAADKELSYDVLGACAVPALAQSARAHPATRG